MSDIRTDPPLDPRGVRLAAAVTTAVLAIVLLTSNTWLLSAQTLVFALGAVAGSCAPCAVLFRVAVAPFLSPPTAREEAAPVRFSQTVGLVLAAMGVLGYATGLTALGLVATAFALVATFLDAAFGFCLGCETYVMITRFRSRGVSA